MVPYSATQSKMHNTRTPQGGKIAQRALPSMENGAAHDGESMRHSATFTECVLGHDRPDERWNREGAHEIGSESVAGSHFASCQDRDPLVSRPKPGRKPRRARNHRGAAARTHPHGAGAAERERPKRPGNQGKNQENNDGFWRTFSFIKKKTGSKHSHQDKVRQT